MKYNKLWVKHIHTGMFGWTDSAYGFSERLCSELQEDQRQLHVPIDLEIQTENDKGTADDAIQEQ